jgi:hypothetical protein
MPIWRCALGLREPAAPARVDCISVAARNLRSPPSGVGPLVGNPYQFSGWFSILAPSARVGRPSLATSLQLAAWCGPSQKAHLVIHPGDAEGVRRRAALQRKLRSERDATGGRAVVRIRSAHCNRQFGCTVLDKKGHRAGARHETIEHREHGIGMWRQAWKIENQVWPDFLALSEWRHGADRVRQIKTDV